MLVICESRQIVFITVIVLWLSCLIWEILFSFRHANDNMGMKEREIKSLHRQFDSTSEDLSETSRSKDIALRENRRLQDDLAVMTRENQVLLDY